MKKIKNNKNFFKKVKKFFQDLSNFQIILIVYAFITLFFALLLWLPVSQQPGKNVSYIDSLFVAASAFSDTGLSPFATATTWSEFGQAIIAFLILIGGVGVFALKVYIFNILFKKTMSLTSRNILDKERGSSNIGQIKQTIKASISTIIISILIATFILVFLFYYEQGNFIGPDKQYDPHGNWTTSFKYAVFHAISAINNAGFDILSNYSLTPYYGVYSIQIIFIILLVIGGIGFPVIYDIWQFIVHKIKRRTDFQFSLFTKVNCLSYLLIFSFGLVLTFIFETCSSNGIWSLPNDPNTGLYLGSKSDRAMAIIFHVFSTRNAGFATVTNMRDAFTTPSLIIFSIMMFIGSAPSSTAGGIRTTTFAILILAVWNKMRGINDIRIFKRKISKDTIYSSFLAANISIALVLINIFICYTSFSTMWGSADISQFNFEDILFEVSSAFGTTGLSLGLVGSLNIGSKIFMMLLMFIGQLGISSTILVWKTKNNNEKDYDYIEENILIG